MSETVKDIDKGIGQALWARMSRRRLAGWFVIISLMVAPAIVALLFIRAYGTNVLFWDQWNFVPLIDKVYTGHLTLADLFAQWGDHRLFFPNLVMLPLAVLTHYNNVAEMYFSWFLMCVISYLLFRAYVRTFGSTKRAVVKFIPIVWLIFSLRQYENLLWGSQISFFMVVLFFLLAVYLLGTTRNLGWRFACSVISGVVCAFSLGNGLLIWPIGLMQILWARQLQTNELRRSYLKMALIWGLVGVSVYAMYFTGFNYLKYGANPLYFVHHPFSSLVFFLASIGSPLALTIYTATGPETCTPIAIGVVLLILYIYIGGFAIRRSAKTHSSMPLFLSLVLFTLLSAVMLVLGRAGWGVGQALLSKHTTITTLGIVGLYMAMMSLRIKYENAKPFLFGFLLSLVVLGTAVVYSHAIIEDGRTTRASRAEAAYYVSTFELQSDENLARLYPNAQIVRERAQILQKYKLNIFSKPGFEPEKLTLVEGTTLFIIDDINGRQPAQQGFQIIIDAQQEKTTTIWGWALDQNAQKAAGGVFITIDGRTDIPALYAVDRRDVADYFKNPGYRFSGYVASFATSVLGEGQHILSLKIVTADKTAYYQPDLKITLEVR
jgi:hypothetical protein